MCIRDRLGVFGYRGINKAMTAKTKARNQVGRTVNALNTAVAVRKAKTKVGKGLARIDGLRADRAIRTGENKRRTMATRLANTKRLAAATKKTVKAPASSPYQPKKKKPSRSVGRKNIAMPKIAATPTISSKKVTMPKIAATPTIDKKKKKQSRRFGRK